MKHTIYEGHWLHVYTSAGRCYDDVTSCDIACSPFSWLRDPADPTLGCVSCETAPPPPLVIGPAVIKHTHRTYVAPRVNAYACFAGLSRLYKCRASSVAASATTRVPETASRSSSMPPCGADGPPPSSFRTCATCGGLAAGWGSQEVGGKGLRRRAGGVGSRGTMQMPVLNTEGVLASFLEGGTCPSGLDVKI